MNDERRAMMTPPIRFNAKTAKGAKGWRTRRKKAVQELKWHGRLAHVGKPTGETPVPRRSRTAGPAVPPYLGGSETWAGRPCHADQSDNFLTNL